MLIIWLIILIILALAVMGIIFGAPYLPTLSKQVQIALDLVDLKKGQTILELGCGDGKILIACAKRQIKSVGYELNPILALICYIRTIRYREYVTIVWGNYWTKTWPKADAVFVFLIDRYMSKLDQYLIDYKYKPLKLVSFAFKIPSKKIAKEKESVYLYLYK
jgi:16S rRNA A1518/A1519 N6-dimethyltransferase RsmA/KsgA/DIM1 with predicted DNA glycosylase/AP lyase activity